MYIFENTPWFSFNKELIHNRETTRYSFNKELIQDIINKIKLGCIVQVRSAFYIGDCWIELINEL